MVGMLVVGLAASSLPTVVQAAEGPSHAEAVGALRKAVSFYMGEVGYRGAYVYRYASDLSKQEGEGQAYRTTGWTEPPGTPAVGEAYLRAWRLTGDKLCLDAARQAATALIATQLKSGGWDSRFELGAEHRKRYAYRVDGDQAGKNNMTTLDDNKTQSAVMFLMHLDEVLEFKDARLHEAVTYALDHLLAAQYPNGAWPQRFDAPPDPAKHPVKRASYPDSWSRTFPNIKYSSFYTFNDNTIGDVVDVMLEAHRIYGKDVYMASARKTGDFILMAQMPEPQPGWAQQYSPEMHPVWARKFEPPAVSGGEGQWIMSTLMLLYQETGDRKFLGPIPRALDYYEKSELPNGKLPRFLELKTNRGLYFTKDYQLTYSSDDMPTHYGFIVDSRVDRLRDQYESLAAKDPSRLSKRTGEIRKPRMSSGLAKDARKLIDSLDKRGAWVQDGKMSEYQDDIRQIIESRTFARNLVKLAEFVAASE